MIRNLIFEGGGVLGLAYAGALLKLETLGFLGDLGAVGGTSAGAITACLVAVGYTPTEILEIVSSTNFSTFQDDDIGVVRDMYRFIREYGWHKGDAFTLWLEDLVEAKLGRRDITFAGLEIFPNTKALYVVGTNLTKQRSEVFSNFNTPTMRIVDAVRISMSIPLFFTAVQHNGDLYVDGGLGDNFPIKLFDSCFFNDCTVEECEGHVNPYTLGLRVDSKDEIFANKNEWNNSSIPLENVIDVTQAVVLYMMKQANKRHLNRHDAERTVFIDSGGVDAVNFNLSKEDGKKLIRNGKKAVESYLPDIRQQLNSIGA